MSKSEEKLEPHNALRQGRIHSSLHGRLIFALSWYHRESILLTMQRIYVTSAFLQKADYEYPVWETFCTGSCNATCLPTSHFLATNCESETVVDSVAVSALTDHSMSFRVLLSNTKRFLPSAITWKSCTHVEGMAYIAPSNFSF